MALIRSFLNTYERGSDTKIIQALVLMFRNTLRSSGLTYFSRFLWVGGGGSMFTSIFI